MAELLFKIELQPFYASRIVYSNENRAVVKAQIIFRDEPVNFW